MAGNILPLLLLGGGAVLILSSKKKAKNRVSHGVRMEGDCERAVIVDLPTSLQFVANTYQQMGAPRVAEDLMIGVWGGMFPECPWPPEDPNFSMPAGGTWSEAVSGTQAWLDAMEMRALEDFSSSDDGLAHAIFGATGDGIRFGYNASDFSWTDKVYTPTATRRRHGGAAFTGFGPRMWRKSRGGWT